MPFIDLIGLAAGFFTIAAFYSTRAVSIRTLAIVANVLFAIYGSVMGLAPVVILHCVLLPLNILRLIQAVSGDLCPGQIRDPVARDIHVRGWPSQRGFRPWPD